MRSLLPSEMSDLIFRFRLLVGRVALGLGFWLPNALFTYKLQYLKASGTSTPSVSATGGGRLEESVAGLELRRYVMQEVQLPLGHLNYFVRLPLAGTYFLTVYAALLDTSKQGVAPSEQIYRYITQYLYCAFIRVRMKCLNLISDYEFCKYA